MKGKTNPAEVTRLDYFAAAALPALIAKAQISHEDLADRYIEENEKSLYLSLAENAYSIADAMMRERTKPSGSAGPFTR